MFRHVSGHLCGIREEKDSEDRVINDSTDIVPVSGSDRGNGLFRIDLFGRKVQGRTARNVETDDTGDRVKSYDDIMQAPCDSVSHLTRDGDFGRGENRDRAENESRDRRDGGNVDDLSKVHVRNVIVESRRGDDDQV